MPQPSTRSRSLPTLSWVVLVVCVVGNTVASLAGAPLAVHLGLGLLAAVCIAALTAAQLRNRR
ncbi:hypothetical protein [Modestobacter versicolor]|uniref:hypothetical protein n=1 Tax=Modestobacter versicolor TaxID=429133 RepID=UPI0034DE6106